MANEDGDQVNTRSYWARSGIVALNLPTPGLGLIRVGDWRAGIWFLLAPFLLLGLMTIGAGLLPITSYGRALCALVAIFALLAVLYLTVAVRTWRKSRLRSEVSVWSRWYSLVLIVVALSVAAQLAQAVAHLFYKPFYAPSESMAPTIDRDERFMGDMRWRGPFRRGDIVIFRGPDSVRISRIAGIPGDRIAMHGGVPIVNGVAAGQTPQGKTTFSTYDGKQSGLVLAERLPGETSTHRILKTGPSEFDDTDEVVVPPSHLFLLGDNRERAADSRVPLEYEGVGMVPETAVIGQPMYIHWSRNHAKVGTRLDR